MMDDLFTRLFLPLARLAIGRGLGFRDVVDPLKRAFVQAAADGTERQTDSRLSLLTGLQRRDVARLRDHPAKPPEPSSPARIVSDWLRDPQSVDTGGAPKPLPRTGSAPSFEALARAVRQDVHPRTLLDALEAAGTVRVDGDIVHLLRRDYTPGGGSQAQMAYLADNLHDHAAGAVANVLHGAGHFERAAHYSGLSLAQAEALSARFAEAQLGILSDIAAEAAEMQGTGPVRVRFGGYGYWEREE